VTVIRKAGLLLAAVALFTPDGVAQARKKPPAHCKHGQVLEHGRCVKARAKHRVVDPTVAASPAPARVWVTVGRGPAPTYTCNPPSGCAPPIGPPTSAPVESRHVLTPAERQADGLPEEVVEGKIVYTVSAVLTFHSISTWPDGESYEEPFAETNAPVCDGEVCREGWQRVWSPVYEWEHTEEGHTTRGLDTWPTHDWHKCHETPYDEMACHPLEGSYAVRAGDVQQPLGL
jgi:hypothetical protein